MSSRTNILRISLFENVNIHKDIWRSAECRIETSISCYNSRLVQKKFTNIIWNDYKKQQGHNLWKKTTKKSPAYGRGFKPNFSVTVLDNFFCGNHQFFFGWVYNRLVAINVRKLSRLSIWFDNNLTVDFGYVWFLW